MVLLVQFRRDGNNLMSENGMLHDIKNDIVDRLKSDTKNHANSFLNCI
jgi:hypothetical protein